MDVCKCECGRSYYVLTPRRTVGVPLRIGIGSKASARTGTGSGRVRHGMPNLERHGLGSFKPLGTSGGEARLRNLSCRVGGRAI